MSRGVGDEDDANEVCATVGSNSRGGKLQKLRILLDINNVGRDHFPSLGLRQSFPFDKTCLLYTSPSPRD